MNTTLKFEGVFPILVTPFDERENLDLASFSRLVRFMADLGVDGVTVLGVLGESNRLLDSEREELIKTAVAAARLMPVIVGVSHSGTRATSRLAHMAESLGASAVMVTPLKEPVPSDERVFAYFSQVADAVRIPVVVQDHPASSEVHMPVPLLLRLVNEVPRVACIKEEALPSPAKIGALMAGMNVRSVPVLTGLGALYGMFDLERGSSGFNTGFAFPEALMAMMQAVRESRLDKAWEIYRRFLPLIVFEQQPGVAIRKELFRMRGLIACNRVRHPAAGIDQATARQLRQVVERVLPGVDITRPIDL